MRHPKLPALLLLAGAIALAGCTDSTSDDAKADAQPAAPGAVQPDAPKPDYRLAILHSTTTTPTSTNPTPACACAPAAATPARA